MADVWVLGSAVWDVVNAVDRLPTAGGSTTARDLGRRPGGSTANVARALGSAGHQVQLVTRVGTDESGDALLDELASFGVQTGYVQRSGPATPQTLIFIDGRGERAIVVLDKPSTQPVPVPYQELAGADVVFVGWYGDYDPDLPAFLRDGGPLVVTAVPPPGSADWYADLVIGSESEYAPGWLAAPYEALSRRLGHQPRWVVVTHGRRGASAYGPAEVFRIPPVETTVTDTTGAGDSFAAGVLHGLLAGTDMPTAGRLGTHWAAAALARAQSVPPRWSELDLGDAGGDWPARLADHAGRVP